MIKLLTSKYGEPICVKFSTISIYEVKNLSDFGEKFRLLLKKLFRQESKSKDFSTYYVILPSYEYEKLINERDELNQLKK